MKVTHELTVAARCPVNDAHDVYAVTVRTTTVLLVERIHKAVAEATREPVYQESLTQALADALDCQVETVGYHSGTKTTVVCGEVDPCG